MDQIITRNVCHAYFHGLRTLTGHGVWEETRNGRALVLPYPLVTVTKRPTERVLFDERRDANPFFHLMESIWMLAGSDDGTWLDQFVSDFSSRYAEPDGRIHGAYGARWRNHFTMTISFDGEPVATLDQLDLVVDLLRDNPGDRQCVIQMWDAASDLGVPGLKDRPCNTQLYLRVRADENQRTAVVENGVTLSNTADRVLDLTVTCRSNDAIWGAHGANAVHFSVLQEYLAAAIGVGVGTMYQFSNNYHVYSGVYEKKWHDEMRVLDPYTMSSAVGVRLRPQPMVTVPTQFLADAEAFVADADRMVFANPWFAETARPMLQAAQKFREGDKSAALALANSVRAEDWSWAARRWISRRMDNV